MKATTLPSNFLPHFLSCVKISISICIAFYFFLFPMLQVISLLSSKEIKSGSIHPYYFQLHKKLSIRYESWLTERLDSNRPTELSLNDISGTEWPLFGTVFYLWATESLQSAWEQDNSLSSQAPAEYAKTSLSLSAKLLTDENHASWVKKHWGETYLEQENLFYRMLLIGGLTSYQTVSEDKQYEELLKTQVASLQNEIDSSAYGVIDDYPGECYLIDILPAIAVIGKANNLFGTDSAEFISKSKRGFEGNFLDKETQLPAYICDSEKGTGVGPARGVGMSYMLIWAPELWPEVATQWYTQYGQEFWQSSWIMSGWREFSVHSSHPDWYLIDVDAGPVMEGYGTAASAFGLGSAIVNGKVNHFYPLISQAFVVSWPLPNHTLFTPKLLSNASDAPLLGESALLFILTRQPTRELTGEHTIPGIVLIILSIQFLIGSSLLFYAVKNMYALKKRITNKNGRNT